MLTVSKEFRFEAAHHLPNHDGKCKRPHGHSYRVVVHCCGPVQMAGPKQGMVVDYADIAAAVEPILRALDHRNINEILPFVTTAENLALYLVERLQPKLPSLAAVDVHETASTRVRARVNSCGST